MRVYGVTAGGGKFASSCNAIYKKSYGCGVIYQLVNNGSGWEWGGVVYSFPGGAGGTRPNGLLTAYNGQIFGTTEFGGKDCGKYGCGTIFIFSP